MRNLRTLTMAMAIATLIVIGAISVAAQDRQAQQFTRSLGLEAKGFKLNFPDTWRQVEIADPTARELHKQVTIEKIGLPNEAATQTSALAKITINVEPRLNHEDAVQRLKQIEAEYSGKAVYLNIGGWPAYQRRAQIPLARRSRAATQPIEMYTSITTAIAADDRLIRIEAFLPPGVGEELIAETEAIGRTSNFAETADARQVEREIQILRASPSLRSKPFVPQPGGGGTGSAEIKDSPSSKAAATKPKGAKKPSTQKSKSPVSPKPKNLTAKSEALSVESKQDQEEISKTGFNRFVHAGNGELEIAASNDGRNIVIAANSGFSNSTDGGQTFTFRGGTPGPNGSVNGDPSLGVGASGAFYYGFIGYPNGTPEWNNETGCSTGISVSTNGGTGFTWRSNATLCPQSGAGVCFPDQEHITADRFNASPASMGGGDQVYSAWRNFTSASGTPTCDNIGSGFVQTMLTCSANGGNVGTWTVVRNLSGDFPRVTVGRDGFVYAVTRSGGNILVYKFSSCSDGLTLQAGFPQTAAAPSDVVCPVPGLDRCNDGNSLSSHTIAVDDRNPMNVFVAFASNTDAPATNPPINEDIIVRASINGGTSWPAALSVRLNSPVNGRRFMPWIATDSGVAHVSWYDRRAGSGGVTNDLTDFYRNSAAIDASNNLVAGTEVMITRIPDPQCASGWPCAPRASGDADACTVQPQLAGVCSISGARCDFSAGCPAGAGTCNGGGGCPKYGDYNGIAAIAGRVITGWASATPPPGAVPAPPAGINVYTSIDLVSAPRIQVPSPPNFADTCTGSTGKATLNVCNTGKADLEVGTITSSNPRFRVTTPSSGFAVVISPDFCFPFEVNFSPLSTGNQTTAFTIATNDPVSPSVVIDASAQGDQVRLSTVVADAGNFGDVCVGKFKDLKITVNNSGGCDLVISSLSSSSSQFQVAGVMSFPLVIHAGDSLQIPIRFQPTSFGTKSGTITINSNDPLNPAKAVSVSGNAPSATIVVNDPIVFDKTCPGNTNNKTLTIGNSGGCDLIVNSITSSSTDFKVVGVVPFPLVIPPGSTRDVTIQFMPMGFTVDPMRMATLTINSNDLNTPNKLVKVIGTVPPPVIQAMPDPLDFGKVCLSKSKELPVTIKNNGECNLTVSSISFSSPEFKLLSLPTFPFVVPAGGSRVVMVSFMPVGATGQRMETMTINSDDPATPIKVVTLKGEAPVSDIAISGLTDWGDVAVGKFKDQVFYITNTEACDLAVTLVCEVRNSMPQQASVEFNLVSPLNYPVIIPGGETLAVRVRFKPERKGPRSAMLFVCGFDPQVAGGTAEKCPASSYLKRTVVLTGKGK